MWTVLAVLIVIGLVTYLAAAARMRSSMNKYADDLRKVVRDMTLQSQQLNSVRDAARESKKEAQKRAKELASLRNRVQALTTSLNAVTAERDTLKSTSEAAETRISDLSERLAASLARVEQLQVDLAAAARMRWDLIARFHADDAQRTLAFSKLRRPYLSLEDTPPTAKSAAPSKGDVFEQPAPDPETSRPDSATGPIPVATPPKVGPSMSGPHPETSEERASQPATSPRQMAASKSFEDLIALVPDLSISDPEDDFEPPDFEGIGTGFGAAPMRARSSPKEPTRDIVQDRQPLSLDRAPWDESLHPSLQSERTAGSIAAALTQAVPKTAARLIAINGMRGFDK